MSRALAAVGLVLFLVACTGGLSSRQGVVQRQKLARIYTEKGAAYLAEGKVEIAVKDLRKALQLDPDNASAHGTIAVLYERLGMLDEAAEHYRRAARLEPDDPRVINNYGRFLCQRGRHPEGLELLRRAASDKLYAKRWIPLTNAGDCALAAGHLEEAERYLRQALSLNPEGATALVAMARLKAAQGEYLSARAFLQRYEAVGRLTEETLRLGYRIESALGDLNAAEAYRNRLDNLPSNGPDRSGRQE